jgi:hypothetical protein
MNIGIRLIAIYVKPLKPSGNYSNHRFNIKKLYILHTECIYVFCRDLRKKQRLLSYTSFHDGFLYRRTKVYYEVRNGIFK